MTGHAEDDSGDHREPVERAARFRARLEKEDDIQPCVRRIAQYLAGGYKDGTLDAVDVLVRELSDVGDGEVQPGQSSNFRAPAQTERDLESVCERVGQFLGAAAWDPEVDYVDVVIREVDNDE